MYTPASLNGTYSLRKPPSTNYLLPPNASHTPPNTPTQHTAQHTTQHQPISPISPTAPTAPPALLLAGRERLEIRTENPPEGSALLGKVHKGPLNEEGEDEAGGAIRGGRRGVGRRGRGGWGGGEEGGSELEREGEGRRARRVRGRAATKSIRHKKETINT